MAITIVGGASTNNDSTINTHTLTHGLTINSDDIILFFENVDGNISNRATEPVTFDGSIYEADTLSGHVSTNWYRAGGSEPSSYSWTYTSAERGVVGLIVLRGCLATGDVIDSSNSAIDLTDDLLGTFTALTPTVDNCAVIGYCATAEGDAGSGTSFTSWPFGTEQFDGSSVGSGSGAKSHGAAAVVQTTAAEVSGSVTISHGDVTDDGPFVIAVLPAATGGTTTGVAASDGVATAAATGTSTFRGVASSDGVAVVAAVAAVAPGTMSSFQFRHNMRG